jgi:iron complex transport system ATP-binding protein
VAVKGQNITIGYNGVSVVNDVSLHIKPKEICTIIGPNGSGKSTLLKGLSRTLPVQSGQVFIQGQPIRGIDTKALSRQLAFLPQSPRIPEHFSVRELVSYGRFPHTGLSGLLNARDREIIDWALEETDTISYAHRELIHLSGGERQRVWIAMALAQEAEILFLDEPTTYLDIHHQFNLLELVQRLNKKMGRTILMVLHDLNQAARYSDRLFLMKEGQMVARGMVDEIITEEILRDVFSVEAKVIRDEENNCPYFIPLRSVN